MIENYHIFEGIDQDGFEEYRDFMYKNYCVLTENKLGFITDKCFTPSFKEERLQEMLDFFLLHEGKGVVHGIGDINAENLPCHDIVNLHYSPRKA